MAVIGVGRWVFHLPGCRSLKAKRSVVRGLRERAILKFRVSAAETGLRDRAAMAEITACVVSGERRHAESVLGHVDRFLRSDPRAHVVESETEFL
ncbi:MAG: DUF503 domain-containing protein [Gemmatimonadetes bacterium]|nr:DUF503 domain-containing protein [Gemmatimonadota bacterium]MCZ0933848.1 DUF503 domain-containing protein [Candidatus Palauibacter rhopaloidicola]